MAVRHIIDFRVVNSTKSAVFDFGYCDKAATTVGFR